MQFKIKLNWTGNFDLANVKEVVSNLRRQGIAGLEKFQQLRLKFVFDDQNFSLSLSLSLSLSTLQLK